MRRTTALLPLIAVATLGCNDSLASPEVEVTPSFAHTGFATGRAQMHPSNQSGVRGVINFTDDGTTLTVTGTATGLTPPALSLIYDNGSRPGGPANPAFDGNCEPVLGGLGGAMFIGFWGPPGVDGVSTLGPILKTGAGSYAALSEFKTVSIRRPAPGAAAVLACGEVADHRQ